MSKASKKNKVMTLKEAVEKFVFDGAIVGLGGQNISRCQVATVHEIIRQGKKNLTLTGCNLSIQMDMLVAAGLVKKCECGSGNLERFGATFSFKRAIEEKRMEIEDFSHGSMVSRFLAGEMGLPFIPCRSLLGSDILRAKAPSTQKKYEIIDNPWNPGEKVLLLPAMVPDVAIVHVQKADEIGNIIIEGISNHEPELIRASKACIITCEELISSEETRNNPDRTTLPYHFIDAVVEVPFGAHPTMTYRYYTYDTEHIRFYQECARKGKDGIKKYLDDYVHSCNTFEDYLDRVGGIKQMLELRKMMLRMM
ncbi:MAG: CoA-transferase [Thermodesulfobacteriota bacterium]|nr:CoA-transferase [Thermodesulfobacteriota bacterium]